MESTRQSSDTLVSALIDYENVGLDAIQWLFDQISDVGRIIVKRAYADWSDAASKRDQLLELGIEPVQQFHGGHGKNSSDIRMAIDAVDLLHESPVETFVIVSSDSDFIPLVTRLRSAGKTVIGAGRRPASRTLVISCDKFYYLDESRKVAPSAETVDGGKSDSLLIRAMRSSMDEQGKVVGSKLHQTMLRLDPSFDFRDHGQATFSKYLERSPAVRVQRPRAPGDVDVTVELAEPVVAAPEKTPEPGVWDRELDRRWSERLGDRHALPGSSAASMATKVLGISSLRNSPYKTLEGLLASSELLRSMWSRRGNEIFRHTPPPPPPQAPTVLP